MIRPLPLETILATFWTFAESVCGEMDSFQPNLVIALAHSGKVALRAVQTLWRETRTRPFPPTLLTNIGSEKSKLYADMRLQLGYGRFRGEVFTHDATIGHFLAWAANQSHWQVELKQQIAEVLGEGVVPQRVLVVDDLFYEGHTCLLTLNLLNLIFPSVDSLFIAGGLEWRSDMFQLWADQFHPELSEKVEELTGFSRGASSPESFIGGADELIPGTEDVHPDSLAWRPIMADSPLVQSLATHLPVEEWFNLSLWAYTTIEDYIRQRARGEITSDNEGDVNPFRTAARHFPVEYLITREIWRRGSLSRSEIGSLLHPERDKVEEKLGGLLKRDLIAHGTGNDCYYTLQPAHFEENPKLEV